MRHIGRWQDGPLVTRVLLLLSLQQKVSSWCLRPVAPSDRGACPPHQTLHPGAAHIVAQIAQSVDQTQTQTHIVAENAKIAQVTQIVCQTVAKPSDRGACPPHQTLHPGVAQTHTHTQSGAPPGQQYMIYGFKQPPRVIYKVFWTW